MLSISQPVVGIKEIEDIKHTNHKSVVHGILEVVNVLVKDTTVAAHSLPSPLTIPRSKKVTVSLPQRHS